MMDSYTNRNHCPSQCGRMRGMVVGEGGRSSGVLLYCCQSHHIMHNIGIVHMRAVV